VLKSEIQSGSPAIVELALKDFTENLKLIFQPIFQGTALFDVFVRLFVHLFCTALCISMMLFRLHFCKQFLFCFLNGFSPLENRFLCCNSLIFAPKVLLQRIEVSLVAWSLHWLFAIFTNVNCLCGNFENDYVKSLKVLVWASWFGTVNWTIYFSSTPFVDMSMLVGVFSHLTILTSEVVVVVRLLLTDCSWSLTLFVPYFLASSLVFFCFVGLSKQCWFQELF